MTTPQLIYAALVACILSNYMTPCKNNTNLFGHLILFKHSSNQNLSIPTGINRCLGSSAGYKLLMR